MNANYSLDTYADSFARWYCRITFAYPGLGNTAEAERIASNALRSAKRAIRDEIIGQNLCRMIDTKLARGEWRGEVFPKKLAYEVIENTCTLGTGQLKTLTIAIKNKTKGN